MLRVSTVNFFNTQIMVNIVYYFFAIALGRSYEIQEVYNYNR